MSFETPNGEILQTTPIKSFVELTNITTSQYVLGIQNISTGNGSRITFGNIIKSLISSNADNRLIRGTDNKLFVSLPIEIGTLANLTTANKNNLVSAINELNANIGDVSNLDTEDKSSLVNALNEIAGTVAPSLDLINQTKGMLTGNINDNKTIYDNIYYYNHSTYDSTKFTVTGTPTITNDGIASDFSGSNRIYTTFNYSGSDLTVSAGFYFTSNINSNGANIFQVRASNNSSVFRCYMNNVYALGLFAVTGQTLTFYASDGFVPNENDFIIVTAILNKNNTVTFKVVNVTQNKTFTKTSTGTITNAPSSTGNILYIGNANGNEYYLGAIDLKSIVVRINSVPVFNGNKTGIDTIKPDDYTVNGSLTITNDGIASGFGDTTNYIKTAVFSPGTKPWKIYRGFTTANIAGVTQRIYCSRSFGVNLFISSDKHFALQLSANGTSTDIGTLSGNHLVQPYKHYILCAEFTGTEYKLSYSTDEGNTFIADSSLQSTTTVIDGSSAGGQLGTNTWYVNVEFKGNIDLNECRDYIGGNLVYQPCLKIPYTISKTGSKVVDVAYRDRVEDVYNKFGCSSYYTIQEYQTGNYFVTGTPTIDIGSFDWNSYGYSSSNYLTFYPFGSINKNFTVRGLFITPSSSPGHIQTIFGFIGEGTSNKVLLRLNLLNQLEFVITVNGTTTTVSTGTFFVLTHSNAYEYECNQDGFGFITLRVKEISTGVWQTFTGRSALVNIPYVTKGRIGQSPLNTTDYFEGDIPLKNFEIEIEGKSVYKAIIDPNYTLPIGEIYGMLRQWTFDAPELKSYGILKNGSLTETNGVLSGFSSSNFGIFPFNFKPQNNTWEMNFKFTTTSDTTSRQEIFSDGSGVLELQMLNSKFVLEAAGAETTGTYVISANTTYYVKLKFTGSAYQVSYTTTGTNFTQDINYSSSSVYSGNGVLFLGIDYINSSDYEPWLGSIDLNNCNVIINDKIQWQGIDPKNNIFVRENKPAIVVETYNNGWAWYRIWSDGWCEQGGRMVYPQQTGSLSFLIPFVNADYQVYATYLFSGDFSVTTHEGNILFYNPALTGCDFACQQGSDFCWRAEGYIK